MAAYTTQEKIGRPASHQNSGLFLLRRSSEHRYRPSSAPMPSRIRGRNVESTCDSLPSIFLGSRPTEGTRASTFPCLELAYNKSLSKVPMLVARMNLRDCRFAGTAGRVARDCRIAEGCPSENVANSHRMRATLRLDLTCCFSSQPDSTRSARVRIR